jgi:hypothetical protein
MATSVVCITHGLHERSWLPNLYPGARVHCRLRGRLGWTCSYGLSSCLGSHSVVVCAAAANFRRQTCLAWIKPIPCLLWQQLSWLYAFVGTWEKVVGYCGDTWTRLDTTDSPFGGWWFILQIIRGTCYVWNDESSSLALAASSSPGGRCIHSLIHNLH